MEQGAEGEPLHREDESERGVVQGARQARCQCSCSNAIRAGAAVHATEDGQSDGLSPDQNEAGRVLMRCDLLMHSLDAFSRST
jgi:hypothetical protein